MMESIDLIVVKEMPDEECWLLFRRFAFFGRSQEECENLEEISRKILIKCKGLPLTAKTIGSLLRFKKTREEWLKILDSDLWKLEECEKDIFGPLLLSYNDLPFMIKRCFTFCAIFPNDHNIRRDYLIKLWMAHGYLKQEGNNVMEIVGKKYFDYLASRSFFEEFKKDNHDNITGCKMYDLVYDFARFLTKNECLHMEVNGLKKPIIRSSYHDQVCHLMITLDEGSTSFLDSICSLKRLHSFIHNFEDSKIDLPPNMLPKLFGELTCLKALNIGGSSWQFGKIIDSIPKEIGKLIHLRYIDLQRLQVIKFPEELCRLYNLQILNIRYCTKLEELPPRIENLINLRHLENDGTNSLRYMPIGIQRLTNLRTLRSFVVSGVGGNDDKACSLEDLKNINLYGVDLRIHKLGNVSNVDEARRLELKNRENLLHLFLDFRKDEGERTNEDDETLLEILQPPLNLEIFFLEHYIGNAIFPKWMMSLTKLKELRLYKCINLKHLPPLGKLPYLESLEIIALKSVERVNNEFLGIGSDGTPSSFIFFPKLKSLSFNFNNEWQERDYEIPRNGEEEEISIMPSLVSLRIHYCPKLKALPNHLVQSTTLEKKIRRCPLLGYP